MDASCVHSGRQLIGINNKKKSCCLISLHFEPNEGMDVFGWDKEDWINTYAFNKGDQSFLQLFFHFEVVAFRDLRQHQTHNESPLERIVEINMRV